MQYEIANKAVTPDSDLVTSELASWNVASDGTLIELADRENAEALGGNI